jgi:hypothetical protein
MYHHPWGGIKIFKAFLKDTMTYIKEKAYQVLRQGDSISSSCEFFLKIIHPFIVVTITRPKIGEGMREKLERQNLKYILKNKTRIWRKPPQKNTN